MHMFYFPTQAGDILQSTAWSQGHKSQGVGRVPVPLSLFEMQIYPFKIKVSLFFLCEI